MKKVDHAAKVFIAGSRRLSRLSQDVRRRIDRIVEQNLAVIIGDANGVDKAVQLYLNSKHYHNVVVFCVEGRCRNNVGDWVIRKISAKDPKLRDFSYYSAKDRIMSEEADYGLMLWDGQSRGTLTNIVHLVRQGKPVVVYIASDKSFRTLRHFNELTEMMNQFAPTELDRIDRELQASDNLNHKPQTISLF